MSPVKAAQTIVILSALFAVGSILADTSQDDLASAKKKHEATVAAAKESLDKAILAQIKESAQKEDLATVKTLIVEKESFDSDDALPTHPALTDDVIRYIGARRSSASAAYLVYQNSIQGCAAKNQVEEANKLEAEAKRFLDSETAAVSLNKSLKGKPDSAETEPPADKANATRDRMADFFLSYEKMLESVAEQPTTIKQDEMHRNLAKKLDEKIRNQTWELHCRIKDIQSANGGRHDVSYEFPDEFPTVAERWSGRTVASLLLTQQQALTMKPGDYVIFTGSPRFTAGEGAGTNDVFNRYANIAGHGVNHILHLNNLKVKFQKTSDVQDDAEVSASTEVNAQGARFSRPKKAN